MSLPSRLRRVLCLALLALGLFSAGTGHAAPAQEGGQAALEHVKQAFEAHFPGVEINGVRPTPFKDLYEVQISEALVYTNASADFILEGALIDSKSRTDLTAQRLDQLSRIAFDDLPLELAIKQVRGSGEHRFAVFEDPLCGYCKRLHENLQHIGDYTMYTFLFPVLAPESETKARDVWCARDPAAAWSAWMLEGKAPPAAHCDTPFDETMALARKLRVQGTPLMILADGSQVKGAVPVEELRARLDSQTPGRVGQGTLQ